MSRLLWVAEWLAGQAIETPELPALHDAFCRELLGRGLRIWRSTVGLETLHPEVGGFMLIWRAGEREETSAARAGILTSPAYVNSPTRVVDETNQPFRRRLDRPSSDMPLLDELRADGATDYAMYPFPFLDRRRSAVMSFATQAPGGFSALELGELEIATRLFSPYAERHALRRVAIDLLDTYISPTAGEKVFNGQVERGAAETILAAIWFCDMRGFTRFSDAAPLEHVLATLDDWFECLAAPVEKHGGQILKFMGDGLLAIFPAGGATETAAAAALVAAREAIADTASLNERRAADGAEPVRFGIALHVGEVAFGNIGSRRRLDFTAIGPAVNHASRLEELTKRLRPLVASKAFADAVPGALVPLGRHALRDLAEPAEVFTIEELA